MASSSGSESRAIQLTDEDVAYLMNLLRNASQPIATQQLIDALRRQLTNANETGQSRH